MQNANYQLQIGGDESGVGELLEISVLDTGTGIPAEAMETIFEEFGQVRDTERQGTGLGLPICKGFAELLGGSISVESEVDSEEI